MVELFRKRVSFPEATGLFSSTSMTNPAGALAPGLALAEQT